MICTLVTLTTTVILMINNKDSNALRNQLLINRYAHQYAVTEN